MAKKKTESNKNKSSKKSSKTKKKRITVEKESFPIVGIGASAGGLEALEGFLEHLPADANMAMVIIQHLAPKHKSIMASLLEKRTKMKVREVKEGMTVEPNSIYLNPPNKDVAIFNGTLQLIDPENTHATRLPIDQFFRTLAEDQGEKAICIILSGTGTDGTLGLRAIKGEGGLAIVQEEEQAKYDGMPHSAIATGMVDYILEVEKMPDQLIKYVTHPYIEGPKKAPTIKEQFEQNLRKVLMLVRTKTGHDFSHYKRNTLRRRVERRLAVHQIDKIEHYVKYLRRNEEEVETLDKDLLIGVTNFFRDPDAFDILQKSVIPEIIKNKMGGSSVRVWVPGCATGEEAYSIAILFRELMDKLKQHVEVQIFATDIDTNAIDFARLGVYPETIVGDVSAQRIKKYFVKEDTTFKVRKNIREMVLFAVQDLIKDAPFSKLDLVSCRNVLIYMDAVLQKKILPLFHYTLNKDGIMFLGPSESVGGFGDFFSIVNNKWKVFRRKGVIIEPPVAMPRVPLLDPIEKESHPVDGKPLTGNRAKQLADSMVLEYYAPPSVLVNEKFDILYFNGETSPFLSPPVGIPDFNVVRMAHESLQYTLSVMLHKVIKESKIETVENIKAIFNSHVKSLNLIVRPIEDKTIGDHLMLVVFQESVPTHLKEEKKKQSVPKKKIGDTQVAALEQELQSTKEYLQTTVEELEASNEELKSTNEELQSTNEELQSTNEELETSKEELQSTNEELETINSEHQKKIEELSNANDDLSNLLASTEVGTIFLDLEMKIKRFTPSVAEVFNLRISDVGRPIGHFTSKIDYENIQEDAEQVLKTLAKKEAEVISTDDRRYSMRILPYRTVENVIEGVVVTLVDITQISETAQALQASERDYRLLLENAPIGIFKSTIGGQLNYANPALVKMFEYDTPEALIQENSVFKYKNLNEWKNLVKKLKKDDTIEKYEVDGVTKAGKTLYLLVNMELHDDIVTSTVINVTPQKELEQKLADS